MGQIERAGHMDVSNSVDISDAGAVREAVAGMLQLPYPDFDLLALERLFGDFQRLYSGEFPGFRACDIRYHNTQHVLDVTLAMARLLDGQAQQAEPGEALGAQMALAGIAAALFHDSGYIRRTRDSRQVNGAAYTRVHVSRGARFLADYLPQAGLPQLLEPCTRLIHFTGYEVAPGKIHVADEREFCLGTLLGTADLIAQMADIEYIRKCREYLYEEFVAGGIAGKSGDETHHGIHYSSPEQLLRMTPAFMRNAIDVRLDGYFNGVHRFTQVHFGGRDLYMEAIRENCTSLETMLALGGGPD